MQIVLIKLNICYFKDNELLNNVIKSAIKSSILLKRLERKPLCNETFLRTKTKSYEGKISTNLLDNGILKKVILVFIC